MKIALTYKLYSLGWYVLIAAFLLSLWYARALRILPVIPVRQQKPPESLSRPFLTVDSLSFNGSVFKKEQASLTLSNLGPLAKRFRLAGTFFAHGAYQQARKAIIDDLKTGVQQMVSKGEIIDDTVQVASIFQDWILLREGTREEKLWLTFSKPVIPEEANVSETENHDIKSSAMAMLEKLGKRVGEARWVLKRNALLEYYQELLNDTERLASVFDSLKPVYQGKTISGYVLDMEGEENMFSALGFKQNDMIRKVNSMPMTSRYRAEYFIREFVNDRANAFVIDIERDGKPTKLVYLVR